MEKDKISLKVHHSYRTVVAVCDSELIGKKFEEGIRQLEVKENFFKDRELSKEEAIRAIERQIVEDASFNIVGKNSIDAALKARVISKEAIAKIQGIPFALTLL